MTPYGQALGLAQTLPGTARQMAGRLGLPYSDKRLRGTSKEDAAYQRALGLEYYKEALKKTGNVSDAVKYYHGGPNRKLWGRKTRKYESDVMGRLR